MEFQYTEKTKQMFEEIKKNIPEIPYIRDICCETITEHVIKNIAKQYDDFLLHEFEKCGYTLEELQSGRHKLEKQIDRSCDGREIHKYFVDDKLIFEVTTKYDIISENF